MPKQTKKKTSKIKIMGTVWILKKFFLSKI